jgi:hypothetical protein
MRISLPWSLTHRHQIPRSQETSHGSSSSITKGVKFARNSSHNSNTSPMSFTQRQTLEWSKSSNQSSLKKLSKSRCPLHSFSWWATHNICTRAWDLRTIYRSLLVVAIRQPQRSSLSLLDFHGSTFNIVTLTASLRKTLPSGTLILIRQPLAHSSWHTLTSQRR